MKYTIQHIRHEPHNLDGDMAYFGYEVHFTEPERIVVPYFLDMATLNKHLRAAHPDFYRFYVSTRSGLDLFGPAEMQTLDAMGEEGIRQVYAYLEEYLMSCDWIPKLLEQAMCKGKRSTTARQAEHEQVRKAFKDLSANAQQINDSTVRNRQFCNLANKALREIALSVYPEIASMEPDTIKDFKHFFVDDILKMSERIDEFISCI